MAEEATAWFSRTCWVVLALLCGLPCAACGVLQLPIVRQYQANRLDYVLGEVELLFSAGDPVGGFDLSPDGQWLYLVTPYPGQDAQSAMMNTTTYEIYPVEAGYIGGGWADNHHLIGGGRIIRVPDMTTWVAEVHSLKPGEDATEVLALLSQAEHLFVLEKLFGHGYWLTATDPAFPYAARVHWTDAELVQNLAGIPHTIVPQRVWAPSLMLHNDRVYSPDGKYFVSGTHVGYKPGDPDIRPRPQQHPLAIYEADTEKAVALAEKTGWTAALFGWAADSSGVYLQFRPRGAGYGGQPAGNPLYKLLVPGHQPSGRRPTFVEGTPAKPMD